MSSYREISPSPKWAATIECFWSIQEPGAGHRVTPDGCADILLSRTGDACELNVVGAMTEYRDFELTKVRSMLGVRFRPGRWPEHLRVAADRITDEILPLESLWGAKARVLREQTGQASLKQFACAIEALLEAREHASPVQKSIAWMERQRGCVSIDELASRCGLSVRQFRRVCLELTGLTPKFLARVLRFRHALSKLSKGAGAQLALDCGYYDQAHFINEFRTFAGRTPTRR